MSSSSVFFIWFFLHHHFFFISRSRFEGEEEPPPPSIFSGEGLCTWTISRSPPPTTTATIDLQSPVRISRSTSSLSSSRLLHLHRSGGFCIEGWFIVSRSGFFFFTSSSPVASSFWGFTVVRGIRSAVGGSRWFEASAVGGSRWFIFGNSVVVLQKCKIMPRQPLPNQFVTITAQGKKDPNEKSGISIHKCDITPLDDNDLTAPTYLGRPWKDYSTTVIMQSSIGGFLHPLGWAEWDKGVEPPSSIFYGEYMNSGPGSAVEKRVEWDGYKPRLTGVQAAQFTVKSFIDGGTWLPQTNVMFDST